MNSPLTHSDNCPVVLNTDISIRNCTCVNRASKEIITTDPTTGGQKGVKPEAYSLIPVEPLAEVARVYNYGKAKYSARNWEKGYAFSKSYDALQRHINAFWRRDTLDSETGLNHLAHAVFHCFALIEWLRTHPEMDDRPNG